MTGYAATEIKKENKTMYDFLMEEKAPRYDLLGTAKRLNKRAFGGSLVLDFPVRYRSITGRLGGVKAMHMMDTGDVYIKELFISSKYHMDKPTFESVMAHELIHVLMFQDGTWKTDHRLDKSGHGPLFTKEADKLRAKGINVAPSEYVEELKMDFGKDLKKGVYCILWNKSRGIAFRKPPTRAELEKYIGACIAYNAKLSGKPIVASLIFTKNALVKSFKLSQSLSTAMKKIRTIKTEVYDAIKKDEIAVSSITGEMFHSSSIYAVIHAWEGAIRRSLSEDVRLFTVMIEDLRANI